MNKIANLEKLTVLVVEDEPLLRLFIVDDMVDRGWTVYEATDAIEALAMIELHSDVELVFTDVRMPGMSGVELLNIVHARWPRILLMATSGHQHLKRGDLPDDARFLAKPVDTNLMMMEIRDLVGLHGRFS